MYGGMEFAHAHLNIVGEEKRPVGVYCGARGEAIGGVFNDRGLQSCMRRGRAQLLFRKNWREIDRPDLLAIKSSGVVPVGVGAHF